MFTQLPSAVCATKHQGSAAILIALAIVTGGCGNPGQLETAPVRGTVTLDGQPLSSGTALFQPEQGRAGKGEIQSDGSFTVSTYDSGDGAVLGMHRIAVISRQDPTGFTEDVPLSYNVPERYANPNSSGLTFNVQTGQNTCPLELTTTP